MKKLLKLLRSALLLAICAAFLCAPAYAADDPELIDIYYTQSGKVNALVKAQSKNSVKISWQSVKKADNYAVAYYKNGKQASIKYTNGRTYCTIGGLSAGNCYKFRIYARVPNKSGKRVYTIINDKVEVCAYIAAPENFEAKNITSTGMELSWEPVKKAEGYQIFHKEGEDWVLLTEYTDGNTTSCGLSGLDPAEPYSFRIRAFRSSNGSKVFSRFVSVGAETPSHAIPQTMNVFGANMIYTGESYKFTYTYKDGKSYPSHKIKWSVSSDAASVDEYGVLTAVSKGDVTLTVTDETTGTQGSMLVHCVKTAADVNFVPMINGIPIANKTYPLPSWYDPGMDPQAQAAFDKLSAAAAKEGLNIFIISSYRSYTKQQYTYQNWVSIYGKSEADRISARPGFSEHQLGLAIDVNSCYFAFAETKEAQWLEENCYKYGFILRYPSFEAEKYTGYAYEPWHIRYVGTTLAKQIYDSGLTLEQYLNITSYYR